MKNTDFTSQKVVIIFRRVREIWMLLFQHGTVFLHKMCSRTVIHRLLTMYCYCRCTSYKQSLQSPRFVVRVLDYSSKSVISSLLGDDFITFSLWRQKIIILEMYLLQNKLIPFWDNDKFIVRVCATHSMSACTTIFIREGQQAANGRATEIHELSTVQYFVT